MKKIIKIFSVIVVVTVLFSGYKYLKNTSEVKDIKTITKKVEKSDLSLSYDVSGNVEAYNVINVFSSTKGIVKKVNFQEGEEVKKDDILLEIKEDEYDLARLNIKQAKLNLEKAKKTYEVSKKVYDLGGISKNELDNNLILLDDAKVKYNTVLSEYEGFNKYVKSPITGVILKSNVDADYMIDKSKPLFKIVDTDKLQIVLEISNSKAKDVSIGDKVYITSDALPNNKVLEGNIESLSNIRFKSNFSNENVTRVYVKLDNYETLKPGDYVNAQVVYLDAKDRIIVPFNYIMQDQNGKYIYIVKNNIVYKKEVVLGITDGINFEIKQGLNQGETILYNANNKYKVGDKIK